MNSIVQSNSMEITMDYFQKLKEIAIESGFKAKNRKDIYTMVFHLDDTKQRDMITITKPFSIKYAPNLLLPMNIDIRQLKTDINGIDVLKKDTNRCIYNKIKPTLNEKSFYKPFELDKLEELLIYLINSDKLQYYYYQGYLDVASYIFLLFPEDKRLIQEKINPFTKAYSMCNSLSELFLKDYLDSPYKNMDLFIHVGNLWTDIIGILSKDIGNYLKENMGCLMMILSWVITLMTHDITDIDKMFKVLDYLIFSEPYAIYILSAHILIDELRTIEDPDEYIIHIQSIQLNSKFNTNDYFKQTDSFILKYSKQINHIRTKYKTYLPLICEVNYHGLESFLF